AAGDGGLVHVHSAEGHRRGVVVEFDLSVHTRAAYRHQVRTRGQILNQQVSGDHGAGANRETAAAVELDVAGDGAVGDGHVAARHFDVTGHLRAVAQEQRAAVNHDVAGHHLVAEGHRLTLPDNHVALAARVGDHTRREEVRQIVRVRRI